MTGFWDRAGLVAAVRRWFLGLIGLGRYQKRAILAVIDFTVLSLALWLSLSLRLGEFYLAPSLAVTAVFFAAPLITVAVFFQLGLYRLVTRFMGSQGATLIAVAVGLSGLVWAFVVLLSGVSGVPRSVVILYPILGAAFIWSARQVAGWLLETSGIELPLRVREKTRNVLIYGAGTNGLQLLEALRHAGHYAPVGFIDPSPTLIGQYVGGVKVFRPERMAALVQRHNVSEVLLAMPMAKRQERQAALRQIEPLMVAVRTLPAMADIAAGRVTVSDLRPVGAEDLLGRDPVPPDDALLARNISGKSVMITGAGGSIGSELVRQILRYGPRRLILLESSEAQLYLIEAEIEELLKSGRAAAVLRGAPGPEIVAVLGSVQDAELVRQTIESNGAQAIYHAAAYKHVPIVEHNAVAGLRNNTFGTAIVADMAERCGVERFVLISTDKAVRPTSIMGASKRLAEMILQARAAGGKGRTVFTMVRFGNVLDSSGSVVRKFRRQIEGGGPVTVTHREAIRYFMSIPEAAALVIQAGAMATGGDVFVLDMGEPVKIDELARSMIRLMGLEVRDADNPDGDIAIEYIGLRPGEKLHEELLLGENITETEHPRILRSHEPYLPADELSGLLAVLQTAMSKDDLQAIHSVLMRAVEGYRPELRHLVPAGAADSTLPAERATGA